MSSTTGGWVLAWPHRPPRRPCGTRGLAPERGVLAAVAPPWAPHITGPMGGGTRSLSRLRHSSRSPAAQSGALTPRNHPYTALHFQGFCRIHLDPQPSTDGAMTRCDRRGDQL